MKRQIIAGLGVLCLIAFNCKAISEQDAYAIAKTTVPESYRTHVISIYGKGTDKAIHTWYVNFLDPLAPNKGRVVVVQDAAISRTYVSDRDGYDDNLSFDPALLRTSADKALATARSYATQNQINYDAVSVGVRRTEVGRAPVWHVELKREGRSQGVIYTRPEDAAFVSYSPPPKEMKGEDLGKEITETFKGIGADLEEFFTGERTVDK